MHIFLITFLKLTFCQGSYLVVAYNSEHILRREALEIAHKIARNPPLAVQALKAGLRRTTEPDWRDTGRWAIEQITRLRGTQDSKEGVAAFLEKREPVYQGR
jgi:enoyl-CoA hydratase/carnithine racemase